MSGFANDDVGVSAADTEGADSATPRMVHGRDPGTAGRAEVHGAALEPQMGVDGFAGWIARESFVAHRFHQDDETDQAGRRLAMSHDWLDRDQRTTVLTRAEGCVCRCECVRFDGVTQRGACSMGNH